MAIIRLQHIGMVTRRIPEIFRRFEEYFGLRPRDFRDNQGKGMQLDARIPFGNRCWLHLVQNWNPESRVNRFLRSRGEALEHIALQTRPVETVELIQPRPASWSGQWRGRVPATEDPIVGNAAGSRAAPRAWLRKRVIATSGRNWPREGHSTGIRRAALGWR